uniref:Uncharacterized protein n=1 Tax=Avena sativa TaxID=4498 RepID=A0ACD5TSX6_AVESA
MAALMDLDLNCSPPEPEPPAPQANYRLHRAMLRQAFRHEVKDLHRLYLAHKNLPADVPFWNQSDAALYARHSLDGSSQVIDLEDSEDRPADNEVAGKRPLRCGNETAVNLGVDRAAGRKPDHEGVQGRSGHRRMIDLEKLATSEDDDDDVEFVSSAEFSVYASHKGRVLENSQRRALENTANICSGELASIPVCTTSPSIVPSCVNLTTNVQFGAFGGGGSKGKPIMSSETDKCRSSECLLSYFAKYMSM